ncbi:MAG: glycosyltransferase [Muribaculaceae bacterium]|nr:glycosyltransferase [Muribaculaceae bacterium]
MKVLHTIGGFGAKSGGTSTCTYDLLSAINSLDDSSVAELLTPSVTDKTDRIMGNCEPWIKVVENDYRTPLSYSSNMSDFLKRSDYDIYHTNGMWMHINHSTCAIARKKGKPYIITPHGMLYPEALARSAWKKWPLRKIWFDRDIRDAACIHVTCEDEMHHVRALGYNGPIALIGNPVNVLDYTIEIFGNRKPNQSHLFHVGFLGRLHPRKKVENIIAGVALSPHKNVRVLIIGKGDEEYERFLAMESKRLGVDNQVHFLGFLNGREKYEQLSRLDALFVPSDMENFGMIIPEALIVGTPVMASLGTPWQILNDEKCGWWVDNSPESITGVIGDLTSKSVEERMDMGMRGRDYILRTFSAKKVAEQMVMLYQWILGMNKKPEFVYL